MLPYFPTDVIREAEVNSFFYDPITEGNWTEIQKIFYLDTSRRG